MDDNDAIYLQLLVPTLRSRNTCLICYLFSTRRSVSELVDLSFLPFSLCAIMILGPNSRLLHNLS